MFFLWHAAGNASELSVDEQNQALALSDQVAWPTDSRQKLAAHPLGTQTLFIERQDDKHTPHERNARVYQYDYNRQTARLLVIDLERQSVTRTTLIDSVHLPLNQTEMDFAIALLSADAPIMTQLRTEQSYRGAHPFESLSELDVKASIFEPMDPKHACAVARCALLSLFDATRTVFSAEPVVNLDTRQIELLQPR